MQGAPTKSSKHLPSFKITSAQTELLLRRVLTARNPQRLQWSKKSFRNLHNGVGKTLTIDLPGDTQHHQGVEKSLDDLKLAASQFAIECREEVFAAYAARKQ
jgi:hypothetical protein